MRSRHVERNMAIFYNFERRDDAMFEILLEFEGDILRV